jgi:hypothetical protein
MPSPGDDFSPGETGAMLVARQLIQLLFEMTALLEHHGAE